VTDEPIDNRVFVLILQHPQEQRQALSTAATIRATLSKARIVVGLSWPNLARPLGRKADPDRWGVLYLGSVRPEVDQEIVAHGRSGKASENPSALLRALDGIVLLDGTWSQAKNLWWRNPWLLRLHRLVLNPPVAARYGKVRREPRREALSTIEAAALVLRYAEPATGAADALLAALDRLIADARPRQDRGRVSAAGQSRRR
jgi:DTW domain-containing protein YfiP